MLRDDYALATYTVHARYSPFATRQRPFFVRPIRSSAVCCTVLIRHNTSLYLLLIRLLYGLIRYMYVLYVIYPFIIRYILSNLAQFCTVYERVRTYEVNLHSLVVR